MQANAPRLTTAPPAAWFAWVGSRPSKAMLLALIVRSTVVEDMFNMGDF